MRLAALVIGALGVLASLALSLPLLTIGLFVSAMNVQLLGFAGVNSGGTFFLCVGLLAGYVAAVRECFMAFRPIAATKGASASSLAWLVLAVIAGVWLELLWSGNPKLPVPWGCFLWPLLALQVLGYVAKMWPNRSLKPTRLRRAA